MRCPALSDGARRSGLDWWPPNIRTRATDRGLDTEEGAVALANESEYGLAASAGSLRWQPLR
jgi:hypothetical protein